MNECKKCRSLFSEALYDELNVGQEEYFNTHLLRCSRCQSEFNEMKSTLEIMSQRIRPEPGQAFWENYSVNLSNRMEAELLPRKQDPQRWSRKNFFNFAPRWAFQAVAALFLIGMGIFIGKRIDAPSNPIIQQAGQSAPTVSQMEPGLEFVKRTQNYLDRSELILLAIVNFDPETEDPYALNLPGQQRVSRELVQEAGYLKAELAGSGQRRLQNLVTDLEVILLQIANLESENDLESILFVKKGADSRGVLLKIQLMDIRRTINKGNKTRDVTEASF